MGAEDGGPRQEEKREVVAGTQVLSAAWGHEWKQCDDTNTHPCDDL